MSEKRKRRNKLDSATSNQDAWAPSAEELDIAKYLFRKLKTKDGRLSGAVVRTFTSPEAVELLLESPWAKVDMASKKVVKNGKPHLFINQSDVVSYMNTLLQKHLFYRAIRVRRKPLVAPTKLKDNGKLSKFKNVADKSNSEGKVSSDKSTPNDNVESSEPKKSCTEVLKKSEETSPSSAISKSTSSKLMRLEIHPEQVFVLDDPLTVYVWIYEPPPGLFIWLAGSALLLGIILCCLFPIWPVQLRTGAYYLTICASGLFGLLLLLGLVRLVIYLVVWIFTFGRYAFWLFPNLFEDCGFFDSFRPVYMLRNLTATPSTAKTKKSSSKSNRAASTKSKPGTTSDSKTPVNESNSNELSSPNTIEPVDVSTKTNLGKID